MKLLAILFVGLALVLGCRKRTADSSANPGGDATPPPSAIVDSSAESPTPPPPPPHPSPGEAAATETPGEPPPAPAGGERELLDLSAVRAAVSSYTLKTGKIPNDLDEVVKAGYLRSLPVAPAGYRLHYDSITVTVSVIKKW